MTAGVAVGVSLGVDGLESGNVNDLGLDVLDYIVVELDHRSDGSGLGLGSSSGRGGL